MLLICLFIFDGAGSLLLCRFFSSCGECGLLYSVAALAEHRLQGLEASVAAEHSLSSCDVET